MQSGLAEETELLLDCLARVESVLGRAEAALAKLEVVPVVSPLPELQTGSSVGEEASLYGHFSPRATSCLSSRPVLLSVSGSVVIDEVVTPVLQIMPELRERCGEPTSPLSMVLPKEMVHVMSVGDEVDEVGALAPNSEALKTIRSPIFDRESVMARIDEVVFTKKLCRLLASLEAANLGPDKAIAGLLAEEASTGEIKKVKKALRSIGKKSGAIGKASSAV